MVIALWWSRHRSCDGARLSSLSSPVVTPSDISSCMKLHAPSSKLRCSFPRCSGHVVQMTLCRCPATDAYPANAWMLGPVHREQLLKCAGTRYTPDEPAAVFRKGRYPPPENRCATATTARQRGERDGGAAHENEEEDMFGGGGNDSGGRQCGLRSVLPEL